ncbi:MAG: tyrosine--tRNA ligase [Candidatus Paceibacterota bacterium]
MEKKTETQVISDILERGTTSFIDPQGEFKKKLEGKIAGTYTKDIHIKFGVDPTRPDIHIGHAVILRKLRKLQDMGCKVIFLVGDFTAHIGDPTGKSKVRPEIEQSEIEANMKTYLEQVGKILDTRKEVFTWIRNSDWFVNVTDLAPHAKLSIKYRMAQINPNSFIGKSILYSETRMQKTHLNKNEITAVTLKGLLWTLKHITHAQLIERDMFQERLKSGSELYMHEMLYPVLQGVDSYVLYKIYGGCDLEIGGSDQTFNMLMGRSIMKANGLPEQSVLSCELIVGTDGNQKMSKSLDNYISIIDAPSDMFGKVMSIPDEIITQYAMLATYISEDEIEVMRKELSEGKVNPRDSKARIARAVVSIYHGEAKAEHAEEQFTNTFSKKGVPDEIPEVALLENESLLDVLVRAKCVDSKSEGRRLFKSKSIKKLPENTILEDDAPAEQGEYKIGKHRFLRIK